MLVKSLLGEFLQEAENTRKLLKAIPNSALDFIPATHSWTTAQLASHIAEIYDWYPGTFQGNEFSLDTYKRDEVDISEIGNLLGKFERAFNRAKESIESATDESMFEDWKMTAGGKILLGPMPRIQVVRGFLMNHIYHHRGEMIVYLRATGNKVPGLYGPVYEESFR
ncbi:putative damage-inducible protein DinB [Pedobacter sp. W3I1]|uniref:DinB family protein n=1 Tax=Pedobacter sp. W3I1 TaxID=3042291 RepID=UPI00277E6CA4|nr:DinB family protein [Pedobacter sp. W3I1]MDQ0640796.1 putative damage-inducible protein DinB [Pedobacter sp. W3I1]